MNKKTPHYCGREFADLSKHDGGLSHAVGASNYQVMRANRTLAEEADGVGNTYNHAPDMTFWKGRFYVQYLSNPVDEHRGAGRSFLVSSEDGIVWGKPKTVFPVVRVPAGKYFCKDGTIINVPQEKEAFMHQRMAFYQSSDNRLLASGFYGHTPHHDRCPWNNYGMGRVVREIFEDGSFGEIYFIRWLDYSGWTPEKLPFPIYTECKDSGFVAACKELLENRLVTQQWREEHGYSDDTIGFRLFEEEEKNGICQNKPFEKASSFCWYELDEKNIIGLWKQGIVGRSEDGGKTWLIKKEPSFATSGAKAWGQKCGDGKYAICYVNSLSSEHRYPLVAVTSEDGISFDNMACVFGELPPRRYEGIYKDFGPQYIRGIGSGNGKCPNDAIWLCHSINKEDIGVTRIPLPVKTAVEEHVNDNFENCNPHIKNWNIYSTKWSPISVEKLFGEEYCMKIADKDPCDYARAMRIFPKSEKIKVSLEVMSAEQYEKNLEIEIANGTGIPACRLLLGDGKILVRFGSNNEEAFWLPTEAMWHKIEISVNCGENTYEIKVNGQAFEYEGESRFLNKVNDVERLIIRTKERRYLPNIEIYPETPDLENADRPAEERVYFIKNVKTAAF